MDLVGDRVALSWVEIGLPNEFPLLVNSLEVEYVDASRAFRDTLVKQDLSFDSRADGRERDLERLEGLSL